MTSTFHVHSPKKGCIVGIIFFVLILPLSIFLLFTSSKKNPTTAYDECQIEMEQTGIDLDCDDDDADWYKKKKVSKYTAVAPKSTMKSGFGTAGSSSSGG
jgi:hypothetical protein